MTARRLKRIVVLQGANVLKEAHTCYANLYTSDLSERVNADKLNCISLLLWSEWYVSNDAAAYLTVCSHLWINKGDIEFL